MGKIRTRWILLAIISVVLVVADQYTKFLAVKHLTPGLERAAIAEGRAVDVERSVFEELALFYGAVRDPCTDYRRCREVTVVDGFWTFRYDENRGAAFSLLAKAPEAFRVPFFFVTTIIAIGFVLWYLRKLPANKKILGASLMLIFGGAIGNLIDRVYLGYVIDFIHWYAGNYHWPTFNIADSAISTGAVLLLLDMFFSKEKSEAHQKAAAST